MDAVTLTRLQDLLPRAEEALGRPLPAPLWAGMEYAKGPQIQMELVVFPVCDALETWMGDQEPPIVSAAADAIANAIALHHGWGSAEELEESLRLLGDEISGA